jgi:hypothetical protein
MTAKVLIEQRFCGPPDSGHGGYSCGVVAAHVDGPAVVTLRRPPPLGRPLAVVTGVNGSVRVLDGDELVAEGEPGDEDLGIKVPDPVGVAEAARAAPPGCTSIPRSIRSRLASCAAPSACPATACASSWVRSRDGMSPLTLGHRQPISPAPTVRCGPSSSGPCSIARAESGRSWSIPSRAIRSSSAGSR